MNDLKKTKNDKKQEEFKTDARDLVQAVKRINWWEWIPIIGPYLYFARINFARINYIKSIRKQTIKYLKYYQRAFSLVGLPFVIWTIYLWITLGFGFYYPQIGIIIPFVLQFISPLPLRKFILKGFVKTKNSSIETDNTKK